MLKLYGFAVSNYYNMVKLALLEKGVPFEEVPFFAQQTPEALAISPRGKVPVLGVEQGFVNETSVILEYIEQTQPGPKLLPVDPFERAHVLALAKEIELYIELPARLCYAEVFFGGRPTPEGLKRKAERDMIKGFAALSRRAQFTPYVMGDQFTIADVYFLYSVDLAAQVAKKLFDLDLLGDMPQARALLELLAKRPSVQKVAAERAADIPLFLERIKIAG